MISYTWETLLDQMIAYLHRYVSKATGNMFDKYLSIVRHFRYLLWVAQGPSAYFSFLLLISATSKVTETNINTPREITTYDLDLLNLMTGLNVKRRWTKKKTSKMIASFLYWLTVSSKEWPHKRNRLLGKWWGAFYRTHTWEVESCTNRSEAQQRGPS